MAFKGKYPIPSKICINNTLIERVNSFNYLGYQMSFGADEDMANKISKYIKVTGVINQMFKPSQVQRHTRLKIYKTLVKLVLACSREAWTIKKVDKKTADYDRNVIH